MPTGKIPFGSLVSKNTNDDFVTDRNSLLVNGYLKEEGVTAKWPGLNLITSLSAASGSAINGLYWWPMQGKMVTVGSGIVALVSYSGGVYSSINLTNAVPNTGRLTFAYDAAKVYIADGGKIMYSDGTANSLIDIADADAPTSCTHVAYLDGYIIANNSNSRFYFSAIEDGSTWSALDFASASGNPDTIQALVVYDRKIFLVGNETTEIWYNDGETPFSRGDGGFIENGTIAPNSVIKTRKGVIWLDTERNLVISTGGQPETLSLSYQKEIDSIATVSDCESLFIEWEGSAFIVLNFPTSNRTLMYNMVTKDWSELGEWNSASSSYNIWRGKTYAYAPSWGKRIVGDRYLNYFHEISPTDLSNTSGAARFVKRTGFINYGSDSLKRCNRVTLKVKRGYGAITSLTVPKLLLRWRNDGSSQWSNEKEISLGLSGDPLHVIDVYPRGAYRTRQYELSCSENVPLAFMDAEEDYTVLR